MRLKILLASVFLSASGVAAFAATDIPALVVQLKQVHGSDSGISAAQQDVATKFLYIGAPAIPYLIPLLKDESRDVRTLAGYILRDIDGLKANDLDALIAAERGGNEWIPLAIAHIGTPKAVDFMVDEFAHDRDGYDQISFAIRELGAKAVPGLEKAYAEDLGWDLQLERSFDDLFHDLGPEAAGAVHPLLKIVANPKMETARRAYAISALGAIGVTALPAVPTLLTLSKFGPVELQDDCEKALENIGPTEAVPLFLKKFASDSKDEDIAKDICSIAKLHGRGITAGPTLMPYLDGTNWDSRAAAARALGYIGYKPAIDKLITLADYEKDWRVALGAAESLGRLHAEKAVPALIAVSQSYWYPPVRGMAATAIKVIKSGSSFPPQINDLGTEDPTFEDAFFDYNVEAENADMTDANIKTLLAQFTGTNGLPLTPANDSGSGHEKATEVEKNAVDIDSIGPAEQTTTDDVINVPVKVGLGAGLAGLGQGLVSMKMHGRKVGEGYFVCASDHANALPDMGTNVPCEGRIYADANVRDDWFGCLDFVDSTGISHRLLNVTTKAVYKLGDEYVAVAGSNPDDFNSYRGSVLYRLREDSSGQWTAERWLQLPAFISDSSCILRDGRLLVRSDGGSAVVSADGSIRSVAHVDVPGKSASR